MHSSGVTAQLGANPGFPANAVASSMRTGCRSYAKSGDIRYKTLFQNLAER